MWERGVKFKDNIGMRLPRTPHDELWLKACALVAIEEMEKLEEPVPGFEGLERDYGLIEFALIWMDECAEVVW